MKRVFATIMGSLVIGFTVFGCAQMSALFDEGWITLFDGTSASLNNWNRVGTANWRLEDGAVVANKGEKGGGYLVSKNSYKDLMNRTEFWVSDDANSGIYIRCTDLKKISTATAYEVQIYDQRPDPSYGTGAIVGIAKVSPMPKAGGKCNTYEITVKGSQFTVTLNGIRTVDGVQDSKFASGPIALQYTAGVVKFPKVQIKEL